MSSTLVIQNGTLVLPDKLISNGVVVCRNGRIRAVGKRGKVKLPKGATVVDARGGYITPGFIDIHVHGGDGADFMDGTPQAVRIANRAHARHGTTTIFPTTTTGSPQQIRAMLESCKQVQRDWTIADGSRIGGVHFYGPYFAADKVGCHLKSGRRNPSPREYRSDFDLGIVKIATCAAELPGAAAFYREARRRKYLVTCGHSDATWSEMERAFQMGMRHVDHFWCAMSSVQSLRERHGTPMQGSMEQFVLFQQEMSTEVIADGMHLSPELLNFAFQMKGAARLCLVTDSSRALDCPAGRYRFGPKTDGEWFRSNGKVGYQPGLGLASSIMGMDTMLRNMARLTKATVVDSVRMATLTPAERVGIAREVGSIAVGKRADLLVIDKALRVNRVFIGGAEHHPAPARS